MRRFLGLLMVLMAAFRVVATPSEERVISGETMTAGEVVTRSGLKYQEVKLGTGATANKGDTVEVHYILTLTNGKKVDSSVDRKVAFTFAVGGGQVIKGFDEGVAGMKVGGRRKLIVPSVLGYGPNGAGPDIPPNAVLIFEIELLKIK
jgi:peptidylprolyl isomerase